MNITYTPESDHKNKALFAQISEEKRNHYKLHLEYARAQSLTQIMDDCSYRCHVNYRVSGLKNYEAPDLMCFQNCVYKGVKFWEHSALILGSVKRV